VDESKRVESVELTDWLNVRAMLAELSSSGAMDRELYQAIVNRVLKLDRHRESSDSVARVELIDQWLERILRQSRGVAKKLTSISSVAASLTDSDLWRGQMMDKLFGSSEAASSEDESYSDIVRSVVDNSG
jgi:hypothetical protein